MIATSESTRLSDRELLVRGFRALAETFGDVDAERFIMLTIREPKDYTVWREHNMYMGESVHSVAERARQSGARLREKYGLADHSASSSSAAQTTI